MRALMMAILIALAPAVSMAQQGDSATFALRGEGYVGFSTLELEFGSLDGEEEAFQGGGAASAAAAVGPLYLQADVFGDKTDYDDLESSIVGVGGHVGLRDPRVGAGGLTAVYNNQEVESLDIDLWRVGLEGEIFLDILSVSANLGYAEIEIANVEGDSFYFDGGLSLYPIDQLRLAAGGGFVEPDGGDAIGLVNAGAEYFVANPVAAFARWEASFLDEGGVEIDQHSLVFGVRLYWGADDTSLIEYDRAHFKESCIGFLLLGRIC